LVACNGTAVKLAGAAPGAGGNGLAVAAAELALTPAGWAALTK